LPVYVLGEQFETVRCTTAYTQLPFHLRVGALACEIDGGDVTKCDVTHWKELLMLMATISPVGRHSSAHSTPSGDTRLDGTGRDETERSTVAVHSVFLARKVSISLSAPATQLESMLTHDMRL